MSIFFKIISIHQPGAGVLGVSGWAGEGLLAGGAGCAGFSGGAGVVGVVGVVGSGFAGAVGRVAGGVLGRAAGAAPGRAAGADPGRPGVGVLGSSFLGGSLTVGRSRSRTSSLIWVRLVGAMPLNSSAEACS